jgi:uncharacterized protein YjhX (UPF0386 family)
MTLDGPAGSGKTLTALRFAHELAQGGKIAVIDTERGSAAKYAGDTYDGNIFAFDVLELQQFSPQRYIEGIQAAGRMGYSVLLIDSLSHAWEGTGGALEMKQKAGDSWSSWRQVTPIHNAMIDAILQAPMHVITTMRSRMEYVQETDETTGKIKIVKKGMAPIQRPGTEYEFDLVCDIDQQHIMTVGKSRCSAVADMIVDRPGAEFIRLVMAWLNSGEEAPIFKPATEVPTLDQLVERFGADAVMLAANGTIPQTDVELMNVMTQLEGK